MSPQYVVIQAYGKRCILIPKINASVANKRFILFTDDKTSIKDRTVDEDFRLAPGDVVTVFSSAEAHKITNRNLTKGTASDLRSCYNPRTGCFEPVYRATQITIVKKTSPTPHYAVIQHFGAPKAPGGRYEQDRSSWQGNIIVFFSLTGSAQSIAPAGIIDGVNTNNPLVGSIKKVFFVKAQSGWIKRRSYMLPPGYAPIDYEELMDENRHFPCRVVNLKPQELAVLPLKGHTNSSDQKDALVRFSKIVRVVATFVENRLLYAQRTAGEMARVFPGENSWELRFCMATPVRGGEYWSYWNRSNFDYSVINYRMTQWSSETLVQISARKTQWMLKDFLIRNSGLIVGTLTAVDQAAKKEMEDEIRRKLFGSAQYIYRSQGRGHAARRCYAFQDDEEDHIPYEFQDPDLPKIWIQPSSLHTGFKHIFHVFKSELLTKNALTDSPQATILQQVLGGIRPAPINDNYESNGLTDLNEKQTLVAKTFLSKDSKILFAQCPAGSGKSKLISSLVDEFTATTEESILVLATTNTAAEKVAKAIHEVVEDDVSRMLLLRSSHSEFLDLKDSEALWYERYRLVSILKKLYDQGKIPEGHRQDVEGFLAQTMEAGTLRSFDADILGLVKHVYAPRVIVATVAMVEQYIEVLKRFPTVVIFPDANRISFAQFLSLTVCFKNMGKVLLLGDRHQLPVHQYHLAGTDAARGGLESIIEIIQRENIVPTVYLDEVYRSHPNLFPFIKQAYNILTDPLTADKDNRLFHEDPTLKTPLTCADRNLFWNSSFRMPKGNIPLAILSEESWDNMTPSESRYNLEQESCVVKLVEKLRSAFPTVSIDVVCYYSGARVNLAGHEHLKGVKGLKVRSVDQEQGEEADIVIVVTTRVTPRTMKQDDRDERDVKPWIRRSTNELVGSAGRAIVALTRAKEAMFVVGDLQFYRNNSKIWKNFYERAVEQKLVVTANYFDKH
ncbi:hypothetical protein L596_022745 [Steinernema carpocapsae]|uniref:DNA2/NAM7 helicase-like C-terminal domain-containing protein n=1 Tax=Steinernema carpocapsae TaxID=34508 RepID=A0A4U5MP03_STECR|nr:hypothetical protein L596_022745 [Steinernema carpocapsae]